jgi:putative hemolysin
MKKTIIIFILIILVGAGGFYLYKKSQKNIPVVITPTDEIINSVTFSCAEAKNIQAVFYKNKVDIVLSDGRKMSLPQVISASGARYSNENESFVFWNKGNTAFVNEGENNTFKECVDSGAVKSEVSTNIANPASLNCGVQGGNLVLQKKGDGSEYGLCYFEDNKACEEWALSRGDCPIGGVKTTGFDTIDQKYCAWSGGQTTATSKSICTFSNGTKCSTIDFYNGKCPVSK